MSGQEIKLQHLRYVTGSSSAMTNERRNQSVVSPHTERRGFYGYPTCFQIYLDVLNTALKVCTGGMVNDSLHPDFILTLWQYKCDPKTTFDTN